LESVAWFGEGSVVWSGVNVEAEIVMVWISLQSLVSPLKIKSYVGPHYLFQTRWTLKEFKPKVKRTPWYLVQEKENEGQD
jgi:hypothetical protein